MTILFLTEYVVIYRIYFVHIKLEAKYILT